MPVGFVDRKGDTFHLSVFERKNGGYSFTEKYELRTEDAYLSGLVGKIERVYLNVPLKDLHFRVLRLPFSDDDKIDAVIPLQLEGMTIEHLDNIIYDFSVLGKDDDHFTVAVVFVKKEVIRELKDAIEQYGLRAEIITSADMYPALAAGSLESIAEGKTLSDEEFDRVVADMLSNNLIDFAKEEFSYSGEIERAMPLFRISLILFLLLLSFLSVYFVIDIRNAAVAKREVQRSMTEIYRNVLPGEKKVVNPLYQLKSYRKQLLEKSQELNDVDPLMVFRSVAQGWNDAASMDSLSLSEGLFTIKGEAATVSDVQALADSLSEKFNRSPQIETGQRSAGKVGFTIQMRAGEPR